MFAILVGKLAARLQYLQSKQSCPTVLGQDGAQSSRIEGNISTVPQETISEAILSSLSHAGFGITEQLYQRIYEFLVPIVRCGIAGSQAGLGRVGPQQAEQRFHEA